MTKLFNARPNLPETPSRRWSKLCSRSAILCSGEEFASGGAPGQNPGLAWSPFFGDDTGHGTEGAEVGGGTVAGLLGPARALQWECRSPSMDLAESGRARDLQTKRAAFTRGRCAGDRGN